MSQFSSVKRDNLMVGGYQVITDEIEVTGPASYCRGDVVGKNSTDGSFALVDSSKSDGTENPFGIICDNFTVDSDVTVKAAVYVKGMFNGRRLTFGGNDTADTHKDYMTKIGLLVRKTKI